LEEVVAVETITPEDALEVLGTRLTEDEKEELVSIRHQLSERINWGELISTVQAELVSYLDGTILNGITSSGMGPAPFDALHTTEQDFLYGDHSNGELRKRFILLLLAKKLLGGLKQVVGGELTEILRDMLDYEEEDWYRTILNADSGNRSYGDVVRAVIRPDADGQICDHTHKIIRRVRGVGRKRKFDAFQAECARCGVPIGKPRVIAGKKLVRVADSATCAHREAAWKEGEEGQVAICGDCNEIAPDPGKYRWASAGLEPYGDDPEQDTVEVIIPCSKS
jgi:hypothetical protein